MPATENQRLAYRDKFRSLSCEAFQLWFEKLVGALHPVGDFQPIRKTQGDGGLDGFVISSQLVYAVYAPLGGKMIVTPRLPPRFAQTFQRPFRHCRVS